MTKKRGASFLGRWLLCLSLTGDDVVGFRLHTGEDGLSQTDHKNIAAQCTLFTITSDH